MLIHFSKRGPWVKWAIICIKYFHYSFSGDTFRILFKISRKCVPKGQAIARTKDDIALRYNIVVYCTRPRWVELRHVQCGKTCISDLVHIISKNAQISKFMGPTGAHPGPVGPRWAPWALLSGVHHCQNTKILYRWIDKHVWCGGSVSNKVLDAWFIAVKMTTKTKIRTPKDTPHFNFKVVLSAARCREWTASCKDK